MRRQLSHVVALCDTRYGAEGGVLWAVFRVEFLHREVSIRQVSAWASLVSGSSASGTPVSGSFLEQESIDAVPGRCLEQFGTQRAAGREGVRRATERKVRDGPVQARHRYVCAQGRRGPVKGRVSSCCPTPYESQHAACLTLESRVSHKEPQSRRHKVANPIPSHASCARVLTPRAAACGTPAVQYRCY